jgi:hypothetical protein
MVKQQSIHNFVEDWLIALPYSEILRKYVGNYVIVGDKPYTLSGFKFNKTIIIPPGQHITINCELLIKDYNKQLRIDFSISELDIENCMEYPTLFRDILINNIQRHVKFIPKNKVTDLLFKRED